MSTVKLLTDAEINRNPIARAVFKDIRATRKSDFVNNFWRGLANQPQLLERTWASLKEVMVAPGAGRASQRQTWSTLNEPTTVTEFMVVLSCG